jgi:GMP synthase-like glutamine amidotransferase
MNPRYKKIAIIDCNAEDRLHHNGKRRNLTVGEVSESIIKGFRRPGIVTKVYPVLKEGFPALRDLDAAIIPGSIYTTNKESVAKYDWMKKLLAFIRQVHAANKPMLGICFGHQAVGAAFGVYPVQMVAGGEVGISKVEQTEQGQKSELFKGINPVFDASFFHYSHLPTLPEKAIQLAKGKQCFIQAFKLGSVYGVQFHPDFDQSNMMSLTEAKKDSIKEALGGFNVNLKGDLSANHKVFGNFLDIVEMS